VQLNHKKITAEQCKDSGLALVLICLICFLVWESSTLLVMAIVFLVVAMTYPPIFKPFAKLWFALSATMGSVMSRLVLAVLFYGLVLPVGLVRRGLGKDAMQLRAWKVGRISVFRLRNHRFAAKDLEHPY
jgi:hypothetical protein